MDIITTAVYFGIAVAIVMFLFNMFHCILAGIFGVRIEAFSLLLGLGEKYTLNFKRNHTVYKLGWLPAGGYVKIAGMVDESLDDNQPMEIKEYMLLSKPPIVRFICTAGAPLLLLIPFIIGAFAIDPNGGLNEGFQVLNDVVYNIYQHIAGVIDIAQAETNWNTITNNKQVFPIILCLVSLFTAVTSTIMILVASISMKIGKLMILLNAIFYIVYLYFIYKMGSFYFSLTGFSDGFVNLFKYAITVYLLSLIVLLIIKVLPKNKYF
ncbi:site-2 protease family protein [Kordia sp.]|uniref:site-2 protease family protein n=1 Tax=Kordia sp. TaxID=1965332 RepID=UPI003B5BBB6A